MSPVYYCMNTAQLGKIAIVTGLTEQNGFHTAYSAAHRIAPDPAQVVLLNCIII